MDLNIYTKRLPKPGETVTGGKFKQFLGGKGANPDQKLILLQK
jgi:sugar/nucleoside kinase (ribokinase family)